MLNPEPPQPYPGYCQSDWAAGFELTKNGEPNILCISDTIANNYPTLSYGSTWKDAGFECVSQKVGLTCTNPSGQGFFLSRERWKILANQAQTDEIKIPQSVAQTRPQPSLPMYEDDIIKARALGASFSQSGRLQASLIIENKTAKDLLLALESSGWNSATVSSDLGEASGCNVVGIKTNVGTTTVDPSSYSRLKPKQKLTVNLSECVGITSSSKAQSFSINMSLVKLENEQPTQFTLDISGIPIKK